MTTVLRGRVVTAHGMIEDGAVAFDGEQVTWVGPYRHGVSIVDLPAEVMLLPGLVDIHCHGGGGGEFGPDPDSARAAAAHHHRSGTTSVVASLVSAPAEELIAGMRTCSALSEEGVLAGVHTEGPFLSKSRCGAQDPRTLVPVDLRLVEDLAGVGGRHWRMATFAPELGGSDALVRALASFDVRAAIGHTDATAAQTRDAIAAVHAVTGAPPVITHLFNGMPSFHHRRPGPVTAALTAAASGQAIVELIADGVHLADETVTMVASVASEEAAVLVSDAMAACGLPEGEYALGRLSVVVADGAARLADGGALAGGLATLLDVVRRCVGSGGVSLQRAVAAASWAPARALGLASVGDLAPGYYADILAVDDQLAPVAVWRRGRRIAGSSA